MKSKKLRLRNFFQWSVFVLAFLVVDTANAANMSLYDNVPLDNSTFEMPARLVPLPAAQTRISDGMLDVTKAPYNADNTGNSDAHAAIQNAIDDAYDANLIVFFPSGTYLCSDMFTCFQTNAVDARTSRKFAHKLVGSTEGSRPVLKLMDSTTLTFDDANGSVSADYPLFIHFSWRGTVDANFAEVGYRNYCSTFRGIDIDMGNNPNNSAIRMNSAQYSVIEDVHIYGADFAYGVDVTPGGGGSVSNLKVTGGREGVIAGRTGPSIAGLTLENQSEIGLHVDGIGSTTVSGFSIKSPASPTASYRAVYTSGTQTGDTANNDNVTLVDGTIEVSGSTGTAAIYNYDQDVHMQNVYVKSANIIESGSKTAPTDTLAGNASSWQHVRRYAFRCGTDSAPMVIDGVSQGTASTDHEYYEPLLTVTAPPTSLISRHVWNEADFPSWEDANRVSILDFGAIAENDPGDSYDNAPAIQAALDSATTIGSTNFGKTVFIPRGIFNVSSPITVPAGAKLIGAGNSISQLDVSTSWAPTSATSVLTTVDDPTAEVVLAHFVIVGNAAADAGSGFPDTTAQRYIRHVTVQSGKTLWRNVQVDTRVTSEINRQCTEPVLLITGNAGGRFYNLIDDNSYNGLKSGHPLSTHHKLKVSNTTLPISFYQLNPEHLAQPTGQVSLENCQDIRIYSLKAETNERGRLLTATDVAHLQFFGSDGKYQVDASGYIVLSGQCVDVRFATLGHRLDGGIFENNLFEDTDTGYSISDRATVSLYAKNAPQLQLHDGASISDPELFDGSTGADFGHVFSGDGSMVKTFTVYNGGFSDLSSLAITVDGADSADFMVSALGSTTVTPGGSTTFTITFTPTTIGIYTATAHIASNDPSTAFDISLVGKGSLAGSIMMPMLDAAFVKGGTAADTPQAWADALTLKNSTSETYTRIAMIKVDASGISGTVDSATLTIHDTDAVGHNLYVYGVNDSSSFQNWTGGASGSATWNSVIANGLFTPKVNLHTLGDANLTLLGSQTLTGTGSDTAVTISGQALIDYMNTDTDGLVSLVLCTDANLNGLSVRPHTHVNKPTLEITFESINQPPVFGSDSYSKANASEDVAYSGYIGDDVFDPEGDTLTYSKISGPAWLSVDATGTLSGTPAAGDGGANVFTVKVEDGALAFDTATLNITVNARTALPMQDAAFVKGGTDADTPQAWTDALTLKNSSETYTRIAMIKVDASGISGPVDSATLTVYDSDAVGHNLYVYGVNDSASFQNWTGGASGSATWNAVIANGLFTPKEDLYTLGDANLTLLGSQALAGANAGDVPVTVSGQALVDFMNADTDGLVTLVVCTDMNANGINVRPHTHANASTLTVVFEGGSVNQPPAFGNDPINKANATEDAAYSGSIGADASDPEGDTLTYSKVSGPAWLSVATDGTLSGTPANSDVGVNAFTVQVDATGGSDTATLNITVDNVNDAPTFTVDPISGTSATEDAAYNDSISGTASDIEGDTLTYSKVSGPAWLSVATNGDLSGTPGNGDVGANAFTVQVSDGNGGTDAVTLNISVANVNDAPVFTVDPITGASAMEDVAYAGTISGSATDIDAGATLTYSKVSGPGWLSVAADGSLSGTPGNDFVGLNVLTVQVDDSNGGTDTAALNIIVVNVNDAPFFTADPITGTSATEDAAYAGTIAGSATDVDAGDTLTYSKVSGPAWLSVATDGTLSGTPANDDVDANAFTVQVSDGNGGTVTAVLNITVANVNDAPVFTADPITGTDATEDAAYTGTITGSATDVDTGDTLTYSKVSGPAWLSVATDGTLSGTPANDDVDANAFTVQASDGNGGTVTAVLNITVANVNDAPVFTVDPITGTEATEDAAYAGTIAGSATDVDAGDTLTYSKVSGPAWLSVATDGTLSGTPANDDVDTNAFTVQASDGNGGTVTAVLNITVANVNDAPVFTADPITGTDATEDATYAGTIAGSATDVDAGDTLTYSKVSGPAWLSVATDGTLFGTPANGDVGANAFTVQASDGNGGTVTAVLNITVASGVEPTWKTDADARIAQNRKGALKVVVLDESGNPLPSAAVDVQMQRHHFNFGAAIEASVLADAQNGVTLSSDDQNELNKILAYCNTVVFKNDLKWRNETSSTASLVNDALDFAEANRLAVRGHTILWPHEDKNGAVNHDFLLPDSSYSNSDIVDRWNAAGQTDTPDFTAWIQQSIADRINRMASTYPGRFFEWDTINEFNDADSTGNDIWLERRWSGDTIDLVDPAGGNYSPTTAGKQQLADIRAEWIKMASQANSGASLYLNNYNLMRFDPGTRYTAMANMLDSLNDPARANAPGALGGIGMQSHMSAEPTLPDDIWNRLEAYGSLDRNLTLSITEYDYVTTVEPIETNEADQLEYMLTQAYSHPQVDCFILWGIWDGNNWKDNGPMYDIDWNLKLSGQRFLDLVFGEWWTDESGTSDINGEYELDAFHGEHLVTVTVNGKVYQKTVTVDPSAPNQTVTVMSIADAPVVDSAFVHGGQADTPQAWTDELALKNSDSETYTRISMIKVDTSGISDIIDSAALTVYDTDFSAHSLYVYGVRDSASFQDWTGGGSGSATWNSVMTNGLFAPKVDLHTLGDANLTLLGSQALSGANAGDVAVTVSGQALVDLLNNDSDGLVTLVVCTDMNATLSMRPHTHANAPTLGLTTTTLPPAFGSDPLNKPDAFEDVAYSDSIAGDASDPEGNPITFSKISGPDWLTVSADGTLSGTPLASDAGLNTWTVQVSDSNYGTDTASLNINVIGNALPLLDSAFVRGGADADTPQAWTDALELKNASETYTRIGMIKVDASGISAAVDSATITLYDTDSSGHNLYVYGVNDSASFQNWTGGASGSATWNSVIANGLFTPKEDLYTLGDANLTLLGSQALAGANAGDVPVTVSGQALVDFMNADTDGLVTLVVCTDMNANGLSVRPHTHANAPALEVTLNGAPVNLPPVFGSDPINKSNATEDAAYTGSISADATDPEGDTLTYSKVSGPAWLSVATDGTLSGTPANSDVGANAFTVQVDATGGTDTATLNITVEAAADMTPPAAPSGLSALAGIGSVELNWADNTEGDLGSYTVYRSTTSGSGYATLATDVTSSDYTDSAVVNHTTYYYVVTAVDTNSNESAQSSEASAQPGWVSDLAALDIAVEGTVSGALTDADVNDDTYQTITEVINGSTSALEHKWVFSVTGAELVTFYVEAHHSANSEGDDFVFAYSTDDVNYTDMVTVSKIADNNTVQYFALPSSLNGTVYVRVLDADRTGGNTQLDSIQVDVMVIVSEESTVAPGAASTPVPGDGAVNVANAQLSWTAGMMSASHDVYFGTTASPAFQGSQAGTVYDPGTLLAGTTYYWAIDEVNNSGTTAGSVWSFTTEAQNAAPTVSIVDPLNAQTFTEGSDIYVLANASDSDGSIDNLKLYLDGQFVRQENAAPYEWGAASQNDPLLQNMSAGTYVLEVIVTDNEGATATNSISITVETSAPVWTELSFEDFESGFGSWVGGGGDVLLSVDNAMGTQCLDIQDNSGDASSSWLANSLDVTGYTELKVEFTYMPISMDGSEDFWLQISDDGGSTWTTVKAFVGEVDFFNGTRENPVVTIDSGSYNFTSNVKLKFRCDASGNKDDIYIDEVRISGQ